VKRAPLTLALALTAAAIVAGCRGETSADPPIHFIGDMDWQPKYQANQASPLFEDGRAMRPLVEGTVAQGELREDDAMYRGKTGDAYVATVPVPVDEALLARGQDRFNIYCTPCHDKSGSGHGMAVKRGYPIPLDLASDRVRGLPDGQIFDVITNGVRNMPSYRKQIPVADRWAIVTWVRVLGRSQHATIDDVPGEQRGKIDSESGTP
jgi:mono/diheme cytochrome c family protein